MMRERTVFDEMDVLVGNFYTSASKLTEKGKQDMNNAMKTDEESKAQMRFDLQTLIEGDLGGDEDDLEKAMNIIADYLKTKNNHGM